MHDNMPKLDFFIHPVYLKDEKDLSLITACVILRSLKFHVLMSAHVLSLEKPFASRQIVK